MRTQNHQGQYFCAQILLVILFAYSARAQPCSYRNLPEVDFHAGLQWLQLAEDTVLLTIDLSGDGRPLEKVNRFRIAWQWRTTPPPFVMELQHANGWLSPCLIDVDTTHSRMAIDLRGGPCQGSSGQGTVARFKIVSRQVAEIMDHLESSERTSIVVTLDVPPPRMHSPATEASTDPGAQGQEGLAHVRLMDFQGATLTQWSPDQYAQGVANLSSGLYLMEYTYRDGSNRFRKMFK